ncbi:MAG TPA: hypothetical protein VKE50_03020 [Thermoanaerobaculia bacterium]|nr:hypothetical protein [Thermoanaerobaculia bacterium]
MSELRVPPVRVSRLLLLFFVAGGALISIATKGSVSHFAGGFAAGVGVVLVLARLGLEPGETSPPARGEP